MTLTLVIHLLVWLAVGGIPLVVRIHLAASILRHRLLDAARRWRRILLWLVADGRKLNGPCTRIGRRRLRAVRRRLVSSVLSSGGLPLSLFLSLALLFFLLLPRLPFLSNFFEF